MDQQIGRFESFDSPATHESVVVYPVSTLSPGLVVYSHSTPVPLNPPTGIPTEFKTLSPMSTSSAAYQPRPPHIAIPTSSQSGAVDNHLDPGAIVGIVLGILAFIIVTGAIVFHLCYRKRSSGGMRKQKSSRSHWLDLEGKNNTSDFDSLPPYDDLKVPELSASAHYTKYVPRTLGRLSPVSQMLPPTFDLIKEHHFFSDPDAKSVHTRRQTTSPGYLDDIELRVTPLDARFDA